uniref:Tr-type G domain-containing protein n=1 Tax=Arcella intermedia TaxID=1963864 RepID=A0A6B2L2J2_9EUKA
MVLIGPPGAGKSFLGGQFLWTVGAVDNRTIEKLKRDAESQGHPREQGFVSFLDATSPERKSQHTIQPQHPHLVFTSRARYGMMCPSGNLRYMKSFCRAVGKADLLLLLVSVTDFKKDIEVIQSQLKVCYALSLAAQMAVGVTKCDLIEDKNQLEEAIKEITTALPKMIEPYFTLLGFFYTDVKGSNYVSKTSHLPSPNTLIDLIDTVPAERYKNDLSFSSQSQFLLPIDFSYKIKGIGTVVCGKVISGHLDIRKRNIFKVVGQPDILPYTMEIHHSTLESTEPYAYVGLNVKSATTFAIKPGMILSETPCEPTSWITSTIKAATTFTIKRGTTFNFHTAIGNSLCQIDRISADPTIYKDSQLQEGGIATLHLKLLKPIYLFPYDKVPNLGSFVIARGSKLHATGTIEFVANQNSFESFYQFWPKFHTYLQSGCSQSIVGLLAVLKRLQVQGKTDIPQEPTKKLIQQLIAHWFLHQKPSQPH